MIKAPPCRLYGILARKAPRAILFRRGPSKQVQLIGWETDTDTFKHGQWFKGRIYERRCDLSPDGRLLVYLAASWKARLGLNGGSWTAVSRPPYLTALARWTKGDAWNGGGLFLEALKLGLNNGGQPHRWKGGSMDHLPLQVTDLNLARGEDDPIMTTRELRDGWKVIQEMDVTEPPMPSLPPPKPPSFGEDDGITREYLDELSTWLRENDLSKGYVTHAPRILQKDCGDFRLRREERLEQYQMHIKYSLPDSPIDLGGADWAEWDQRGRLVFSREGCLLAVPSGRIGTGKLEQLAEFNILKFSNVKAPEWALSWPKDEASHY